MSEPVKKSTTEKIVVWTAVFLFAVLVVTVVVPNFIKSRATTTANPCINNLRIIDAIAHQFAIDNQLTNGAPINISVDFTPYFQGKPYRYGRAFPVCPQGGVYHLSKVGEPPTCSLGSTVTPAHVLP